MLCIPLVRGCCNTVCYFTRRGAHPRLDFFLQDVVDVDADPHVVGRERGAGIEAVADGWADGVVRIELSRHTEPVELAAHDRVGVGIDEAAERRRVREDAEVKSKLHLSFTNVPHAVH